MIGDTGQSTSCQRQQLMLFRPSTEFLLFAGSGLPTGKRSEEAITSQKTEQHEYAQIREQHQPS